MAWIETSLSDLVDELADRKDVSRSWIVRRALVEYIEREAAE
jgi:predicted transcriptional regulator